MANSDNQKLEFSVETDDMQERMNYENIIPPNVSLRYGNLIWVFRDGYLNTIDAICVECNNYFSRANDRHIGKFSIKDGVLTPSDFLKAGQYFRIVGSALNDGLYQAPTSELLDEEFEGGVWAMNVPKSVIELAAEIEEYLKGEGGKISPFISESFGGYSYTKATNSKGVLASWQDVFASRLSKWRRIRVL